MNQEKKMKYKKVTCQICKKEFYKITNTHLWKVHQITNDDYKSMFPGSLLEDPQLAKDRVKHLRFKTYDEIYGVEESKKLKQKRSQDAIKQMKDISQLRIRKEKSSLHSPTKDEKTTISLVNTKRGKTTYRKRALEYYGEECMRCGSNDNIIVHHIDMNRENNHLDNLLVLCKVCHGKFHNSINPGQFVGQSLVEKGMIYMLRGLQEEFGLDIKDVNFIDTPKRVARAYSEIFSGINARQEIDDILSTSFPTDYDGMIIEGPLRCYSMCPHHFLPVIYDVYIGYIPRKGGLGLSKLPRLVELLGKAPKLQEDFTKEIVDILTKSIDPQGVMVLVEGDHLCMQMRGVKKPGCSTRTSSFSGVFGEKDARDEFLSLIRGNR